MADNEKTVDKAVKPQSRQNRRSRKSKSRAHLEVLPRIRSELKKIVWFSREATIKSSIFVIISLLICAAVLGVTDFTLSKAILALGS